MRVCGWGQTGWREDKRGWTGEGTLLLSDKRLAHIGEEPRVRRSAPGIVLARVAQAQGSVYSAPDIGRVGILLAIVFPPANRAQSEGVWSFESSKTAT